MESKDKNMMSMQQNHDLFIASLVLILDVLKNAGDSNATKLFDALMNSTIEMTRKGVIIKKVFMLLDTYYDLLKSNDTKLFNLFTKHENRTVKVTIIPAVDIGSVWSKLEEQDQRKIWFNLKYMYIQSSQMINISGNDNNITNNERIKELSDTLTEPRKTVVSDFSARFPDSDLISSLAFNPYIGVGQNVENYGLDDLLSGPATLPDQEGSSNGGLMSMLGLDKLTSLEELTKQLRDVSKEQIETATQSIRAMLGDVDQGTSELIELMLVDITDELKKDNLSNGNPINNLVKIAEEVAHKMMPKIDPKKMDMKKIFNSTKNMAMNVKDKEGNPIFAGNSNPFAMITNMMESQIEAHSNGKKLDQKTEEEYLKDCQKMMSDLGLPNISPDQLKNFPFDKLFSNNNSNNTKMKQSSNKKKKN